MQIRFEEKRPQFKKSLYLFFIHLHHRKDIGVAYLFAIFICLVVPTSNKM